MPKKSSLKMNESQLKAVNHKNGPLLVVAGAGTGKTRVITERIKNLLTKGSVRPNEVLAVTFTEKASAEMLTRLDDVMPLGYSEPWIYTFHSFCDRILKNEGLELGLDPSYKIMSYSDQWLLLRQHLFHMDLSYFRPLGNPTKFISAVLKFISRLQDEHITCAKFSEYALNFVGDTGDKERWQELAHIYETYESLKIKNSKMDFGDLIIWTIKLFEDRPNILNKYRKQFKHVLVDEFQDTNFAQYHLIKLLCPKDMGDRSLLVVGDDSQSIYKFRGAAISNILEFRDDYSGCEMVTLLQNYRSTQEILDASYKLITHNNPDSLESKLGISKELIASSSLLGESPKVLCFTTLEDEVEFVVTEIINLLGREPGYTYKDIAILARANNHLDPFIFALRKHGLPYQLVGNRGLYDRDEIRDIVALLKVVVNPNNPVTLYRALNISVFEIDNNTISKILADTKFKKSNMWTILESTTDEKCIDFLNTVKTYQGLITKKTPTEFVFELINSIGYIKQFMLVESLENQLCINNLNLFLDKIKKFEPQYRADTNEIPNIVNFLDYLELMLEAGENPAQAEIEDVDTINLLTVHASKGLEFPVVFMINLVSDRFPTRDRRDLIDIPESLLTEILPIGDAHIQEERRLFYVGMTRAQKYLYLLSAKNYGGKRDKHPSGFISETGLLTSIIDEIVTSKQESLFGVSTEYRSAPVSSSKDYTPYSLSFSKLEDYKACPLKYKYKHVLNIPTPPSHALSFGISIHDTLRDYYATRLIGGTVDEESIQKLLEKNWQVLGYLDEEHKRLRLESGKKLLSHFVSTNNNSQVLPKAIEREFTIKLGGIKFFGRIDRIDPLSDGTVEIIDYKTGTAKTQKEVDHDDQVAIYAIAAKEALGFNPSILSYYYLEENVKISTNRTDADLEKIKEDVSIMVAKIRSGEFAPTPGMQCSWCDYKDICPYAYKG